MSTPSRRQGKRLIVACDGTWLNSDSSIHSGRPQVPSNVTLICRALHAESTDGTPQIVYYQAGVGTGIGLTDRIVGGGIGLGLGEHIREAYSFIVHNYMLGDEIFLLGFSRGAFTARSVAGLIGAIGVLTKAGLADFYAIFKDFENSRNPDYRSKFPDVPFPRKMNIRDPAYLDELVRLDLTTPDVPIKAVAVWDTVGSLGIPRIGMLDMVGPSSSTREYAFDNTVIGRHVENAFQALALDEFRESFAPSVWEKPSHSTTYLKQCWFPGAHSNIGGGYDDAELSNLTLAWMITQLEPFLDFNMNYILQQGQAIRQYYLDSGRRPRPWSFGEIIDSSKGVYALSGTTVRTPGSYNQTDPSSYRETDRPLKYTNEFIHASVRARWGLGGPGIEDRGTYRCEALHGWQNNIVPNDARVPGGQRRTVVWEFEPVEHDEPLRFLYEDTLGDLERRMLLDSSPHIYDKIVGVPGGVKGRLA
ncbi:MAG: hypothetical protein M1829_003618 [Trizodia sp. TS-e1964]|nr:MAG: hypothetical protein M1829_003618 [Trizodia sp. TS-e1964]